MLYAGSISGMIALFNLVDIWFFNTIDKISSEINYIKF